MAEYLIQSETLDDIADAINAKTGGSSAMTPAEMVTAIGNIPSGGGGASYVYGTISVATTTAGYTLNHNAGFEKQLGFIWIDDSEDASLIPSDGKHHMIKECWTYSFSKKGTTSFSVTRRNGGYAALWSSEPVTINSIKFSANGTHVLTGGFSYHYIVFDVSSIV